MSRCTGCRDLLEVPKHTIKIVFGSSFILYFLKLFISHRYVTNIT